MDHQHLTSDEFHARYSGESDTIEFKQGVSEHKIAEVVTAFSNTGGGTVLVGVDPRGHPVGTNTDGEAEARLHRVVGRVHRPGRYTLRVLDVESVKVLAIEVSRREGGYAQTTDGRVLVRRGAMNVALLGEQLDEFVSRRALRRFESTRTERTTDDVDPQLLEELANAFGWGEATTDRLADHGFLDLSSSPPSLTVAGVLYLLADPTDTLGKPYVEVFHYREDESESSRRKIAGPLQHQVAQATATVAEAVGHDVVVLGVRRYELDRLPTEVLREAIANAVAHRVYEDLRRAVRIDIRSTTVTITSPGPLPEPVTLATIREQNAARNVRVIEALRRFRLAEDAGRGVDLMQDAMAAHLLDPPRFDADDASVTVTLPLTSTVTTTERAWITEIETRGELHPTDRILLVHAARGEALTNSAVRTLLGIDSTHARAALQRLRDLGFLRQVGNRAGARYLLGDDLKPPAGLRLTDRDLREAVLDLARRQPLTNRLVREQFALDRPEALRILKELVASGDLIQEGQRRGTRYRRPNSAR